MTAVVAWLCGLALGSFVGFGVGRAYGFEEARAMTLRVLGLVGSALRETPTFEDVASDLGLDASGRERRL